MEPRICISHTGPFFLFLLLSYSSFTILHIESSIVSSNPGDGPCSRINCCRTYPCSYNDSNTIMLGAFLPFNSDTDSTAGGVILAIQDINQGEYPNLFKFGGDRWSVRVVWGNDQGTPIGGFLSMQNGILDHTTNKVNIPAVIGGAYSSSAITASEIAVLYDMPLTSMSATSPTLSDKSQFPTFSRTCPSDSKQGVALAQLCAHFAWKQVVTIGTDAQYSVGLIQEFSRTAAMLGISILETYTIPKNSDPTVALTLLKQSNARIILFAAEYDDVAAFAHVAGDLGLLNNPNYAWLGADAWISSDYGEKVNALLAGAIGTQPGISPDDYYNQFVQRYSNAALNDPISFANTTAPDVWSAFAYDAVLSNVYAIDSLIRNGYDPIENRTLLLRHLRSNNSIRGVSGFLSMDQSGDVNGSYAIWNRIWVNKSWTCTRVGYIDQSGAIDMKQTIQWPAHSSKPPSDRPRGFVDGDTLSYSRTDVIVLLSFSLVVLSTWTCLIILEQSLSARVKNRGPRGLLWLLLSSTALASGLWSACILLQTSIDSPVTLNMDPVFSLLSLPLCICGCYFCFFIIIRNPAPVETRSDNMHAFRHNNIHHNNNGPFSPRRPPPLQQVGSTSSRNRFINVHNTACNNTNNFINMGVNIENNVQVPHMFNNHNNTHNANVMALSPRSTGSGTRTLLSPIHRPQTQKPTMYVKSESDADEKHVPIQPHRPILIKRLNAHSATVAPSMLLSSPQISRSSQLMIFTRITFCSFRHTCGSIVLVLSILATMLMTQCSLVGKASLRLDTVMITCGSIVSLPVFIVSLGFIFYVFNGYRPIGAFLMGGACFCVLYISVSDMTVTYASRNSIPSRSWPTQILTITCASIASATCFIFMGINVTSLKISRTQLNRVLQVTRENLENLNRKLESAHSRITELELYGEWIHTLTPRPRPMAMTSMLLNFITKNQILNNQPKVNMEDGRPLLSPTSKMSPHYASSSISSVFQNLDPQSLPEKLTLEEVLNHPVCIELLKYELSLLHSIENLYFYIDICRYSKMVTSDLFSREYRLELSRQLYHTYIDTDAPFEVNISSALKEELKHKIQDGNTGGDTFEACKQEVLMLLKTNTVQLLNDDKYSTFRSTCLTLMNEERARRRDKNSKVHAWMPT